MICKAILSKELYYFFMTMVIRKKLGPMGLSLWILDAQSLELIKRYGLAGGTLSPGVSFEVSKDSCHPQYVSHYLLHVDPDGHSRLFLLPCLCCITMEPNPLEPLFQLMLYLKLPWSWCLITSREKELRQWLTSNHQQLYSIISKETVTWSLLSKYLRR